MAAVDQVRVIVTSSVCFFFLKIPKGQITRALRSLRGSALIPSEMGKQRRPVCRGLTDLNFKGLLYFFVRMYPRRCQVRSKEVS